MADTAVPCSLKIMSSMRWISVVAHGAYVIMVPPLLEHIMTTLQMLLSGMTVNDRYC